MAGIKFVDKGIVAAGLIGAALGGLGVLMLSRVLPKMMSEMMATRMRTMMEEMGAEGCNPEEM